jgi:hypothetical protein
MTGLWSLRHPWNRKASSVGPIAWKQAPEPGLPPVATKLQLCRFTFSLPESGAGFSAATTSLNSGKAEPLVSAFHGRSRGTSCKKALEPSLPPRGDEAPALSIPHRFTSLSCSPAFPSFADSRRTGFGSVRIPRPAAIIRAAVAGVAALALRKELGR